MWFLTAFIFVGLYLHTICCTPLYADEYNCTTHNYDASKKQLNVDCNGSKFSYGNVDCQLNLKSRNLNSFYWDISKRVLFKHCKISNLDDLFYQNLNHISNLDIIGANLTGIRGPMPLIYLQTLSLGRN